MATVLKSIFEVLTDSPPISDPRMDLFLLRAPVQLITTIALYLAIIYKIGPNFMKDRKPFNLRNILIAYNIAQIIFNLVVFVIIAAYVQGKSVFCAQCDPEGSPKSSLTVVGHYSYLLLKYFDLVETMFYVLRKKERQISFLHVYHHIGILVAAWVSGKYFPGGQAGFVALYNTLIHSVMYCYYLFSVLNYSKTLWWKKYVTLIQIVQHCVIFLSVFPAVVNVNCSYPKGWMGLFALNLTVIIYLFVKFYKKTYLTDHKKQHSK
ncbi:very long chain fatty acid elongase AAEL008004-like [Tenebrio molitor]|uniref:very long chain fatty acid elongase AAEL008004-like n=1 Tax=Tenebrio molitor TaxID=7067 RepID=UPI003624841F